MFLAYIAGFTSIFGALLSATNSQARIIFNSGREGLLPMVRRVTADSRTPWAAFVVFLGLALGLTYVFGWSTRAPGVLRRDRNDGHDPGDVTYLVANLALPVYFRQHRPDLFAPLRHVILPLLGAFAVGFPLYELVKPGQPAPFSRILDRARRDRRGGCRALVAPADRRSGERVGSIVADESK